MVTLNARLVTATPEDLIGYCARVSNPANQDNPNYEGLLRYCIKNKHWSVFEMATAIVEVEAPRDISRQLLRHRSFSFQEFSQRYSDAITFTDREFRQQDTKNRQNSTNTLPLSVQHDSAALVGDFSQRAEDYYKWMLHQGVAKECARVVLPEGLTMSKLYVSGTLRSWIHYLDVRDDPGVTQHEHVLLARKIREALMPAFPIALNAISEEPRLL
jgi:thymidylate synthase (FAD)